MPDQAEQLRRLVMNSAPRGDGEIALPPTIVVTGGKGGVGSTTVAINLVAALAQNGRRTVFVDAAPNADAAKLLGIDVERGNSLDDVLSGSLSATDALCEGPAGISLLAGQWASERAPDRSALSLERLLEQMQSLAEVADTLVMDSGNGVTNWTRRLWEQASLVLVVTTPDDVAVMDAYATIKRGWPDTERGEHLERLDLRVLVNACQDTTTAADVQSRLAASCRRFLGRSIGRAPMVSRHISEFLAGTAPPLAWKTPASAFARNIHQLGRFAGDVLAHRKRANQSVDASFSTGGSLSLDPSHPTLGCIRELSPC
jgi:MinD-like ATPase involved in chromosome partitioning or flagellar assembly